MNTRSSYSTSYFAGRHLLTAAFLALLGSTPFAPTAAAASGPQTRPPATPAPAKGYDAFRLMRTLNIFDPERRPLPKPEDAANSSARLSDRNGRAASIVLTGTMVQDKKAFAFFTGSSVDFNKVIPVDAKIGDCTIKAIEPTHVDLVENGKTIVLAVGNQLMLDGTGKVGARTEAPAPAPAEPLAGTEPAPAADGAAPADGEPAAAAPPAAATAPPGVPLDKAEILRRMMEKHRLGQ